MYYLLVALMVYILRFFSETFCFFHLQISGYDMGWTLGYMTNITTGLPKVPKLELYLITTPVFLAVVIITSILIILGLISIFFACKFRRQQYKALGQNSRI